MIGKKMVEYMMQLIKRLQLKVRAAPAVVATKPTTRTRKTTAPRQKRFGSAKKR